MKKLLVLATAVAAAFSLSACSNNAVTPTEAPTTQAETTTEAVDAQLQTAAVNDAAMMYGVVVDATMNVVTIQTADGLVTFGTEDAATTLANGMNLATPILVTYTGDPYAEGSVATATAITDATATVIDATVVSASMNTVTVQTADAQELTFATGSASTYFADGLLDGAAIKLAYVGTIEGTDTSKAIVTMMSDTDTQIAYGMISAVGMSAITIQMADGSEASFVKEDAVVEGTEAEGAIAKIAYTGTIGTDAVATNINVLFPVAE